MPLFYYDLASPECYLAAERLADALGVVPEWTPVQAARLPAGDLTAFRQAFAAGRDLSTPDGVVIAAAACEMHPTAVLRSAETRGVREALAAATEEARAAGATRVPALRVGDEVFHGDEGLEAAAQALAGTAAR